MSWFGWGGSQAASGVPSAATAAPLSDSDLSSPELKLHSDASFLSSTPLDTTFDSVPAAGPDTVPSTPAFSAPPLALDQIKQAGVPLNRQMTPYLQMDPSIFRASQPQYIMPEGNEHGKGKFEFMLGHIGWAVGGGFFVGCARGFVPELFNKDTRQLSGKLWLTRLVNATAKHGSGYAQPAGTAVFLYSALEIGLAYGTFRMLKKQRIKAMREKLAEAEAAKAESGESPKKLPRIEEPLTADADHDSAKFLESIPLPTPVESIPLPPSSAPHEPASTTSYYQPSNMAYDPYPSSSYQPAAVGAAPSASRSSVSSNYDYQAYDDVAPPGVDVPQMQMPTIPQSPPLQYDPMAYSPSSSNSYYPLNSSKTYPMMPTSRSRTNSGASAPYSPPTVGSPFAYPSTPTRYFAPPPPQTSGYQQTPRRY